MGRAPCCDKANVKRGPWSPEEDATLKEYVEKNGTGGNWIALPRKADLICPETVVHVSHKSMPPALRQELPSPVAQLPETRHQTRRIHRIGGQHNLHPLPETGKQVVNHCFPATRTNRQRCQELLEHEAQEEGPHPRGDPLCRCCCRSQEAEGSATSRQYYSTVAVSSCQNHGSSRTQRRLLHPVHSGHRLRRHRAHMPGAEAASSRAEFPGAERVRGLAAARHISGLFFFSHHGQRRRRRSGWVRAVAGRRHRGASRRGRRPLHGHGIRLRRFRFLYLVRPLRPDRRAAAGPRPRLEHVSHFEPVGEQRPRRQRAAEAVLERNKHVDDRHSSQYKIYIYIYREREREIERENSATKRRKMTFEIIFIFQSISHRLSCSILVCTVLATVGAC